MNSENAPPAPAAVQNFSQNYSAPVRSFYSDTYHAVGSLGNKAFAPPAAVVDTSAATHGAVTAAPVLKNLPPQQVVESKPNVFSGANVSMMETTLPESTAMEGMHGDIADVDTDSAGMMETLMRNLQRAARQGQV